jgi:hypothetical protein
MSGEKPGYRQALQEMAKRMIDAGAPRDHAIQKAREAAIRKDRKEDNKK